MKRSVPILFGKATSEINTRMRLTLRAGFFLAAAFLETTGVNAQKITVKTGGNIIVKGNATIVLKDAAFTNNGNFTAGAGTVKFTGSGDTTLSYISGSSTTVFRKLQIQAGVTSKNPFIISDSVALSSGNLFSNGNMTLRSAAAGTALVAELPIDGSGNATSQVKGNVTIERYLAAVKSWRLLAAPVLATGAPSINNSWQEGVTTASPAPNPSAGYGTHITGGTVANGFDQGLTSNPSMKYYNNATGAWAGIPALPGTAAPISNYPGYFLYVRGDRSINLAQGSAAMPTSTTLRMKGQLKSGTQTVNVNTANYTIVGNPFTAPVDFHSITRTNVNDKFYVWDSKLSGQYGLGGYVTFSWNTAAARYDATSSVSPLSQYIESGQAIIVESKDKVNPGTLLIKEADKKNGSPLSMYSFIATMAPSIRADLFRVNADSSLQLSDGVLCTYAEENSNLTYDEDALKLFGSGESIAILQNNDLLSIERHHTLAVTDTLFLRISQMHLGNYLMNIQFTDLGTSGLTAVLKDKFSATNNNLMLNMAGSNPIPFSITNDPASYVANRFHVEFMPASILAMHFIDVAAVKQKKDVAITWKVENEEETERYETEHSANGRDFKKIAITPKSGNAGTYGIMDTAPFDGDNYYRIRAVADNGTATFSRIVKAGMESNGGTEVFPNPITDNKLNLHFQKPVAGAYSFSLINNAGSLVYSRTVTLTEGISATAISLGKQTAAGIYELEIIYPGGTKETKKIIIR